MAEPDFLADDAAEEDNPFLDEELFPTADPAVADAANPSGPTPQELQQLRQQAQIVQRFNSDPAFARQVLLERAQQLGLSLQEAQATAAPAKPPAPSADYVATVAQSLSPELQFLAPQIAQATWTATQAAIAPIQRQQQAQDAQTRQTSYEAMARELTTEAPGWESHENSMLDILSFLRGAIQGNGPMTHPQYGSALKLLYRLASGDAQANATAGRRMQQALRNGTRTSSGGNGRTNGPDLDTMISKAKTSQQKWGLAFQHALRENGVSG